MKKIGILFVAAILGPSIILAWLAFRSLTTQEMLLERHQRLLYEGVCGSLRKDLQDLLRRTQQDFAQEVEGMLVGKNPIEIARHFDEELTRTWPLADVGFAVAVDGDRGDVFSPRLFGRAETKQFLLENTVFLSNKERVEVYWSKGEAARPKPPPDPVPGKDAPPRTVEAGLLKLIGNQARGILPRFLQNNLKLLLWYRSPRDPDLIFGAQLRLPRLVRSMEQLIQVQPLLRDEISVALLDDSGRAVTQSHHGFAADWKRPFFSMDISEALPHWELAVYLIHPDRLPEMARHLAWTVGGLIALLLLAIVAGGWLIGRDLTRQLNLARQKTDFVGNVSHELKTPLTSIRMFSELLAEGRVPSPERQQSYLRIMTLEVARLTRLINNVLDFARIERGEKQFTFEPLDLAEVLRSTVSRYQPELEEKGFRCEIRIGADSVPVLGDRDALEQVFLNLLSNAEKYSADSREVDVELTCPPGERHAEVSVSDRGLGVPNGKEEKIFEQFYRAHDSLSSGIPGSGLGLTLAREIARAHQGDLVFEHRSGGGSVFKLILPLISGGTAADRGASI